MTRLRLPLLATFLAAFATLSLGPRPVAACVYDVPRSLAWHTARAKTIFIGTPKAVDNGAWTIKTGRVFRGSMPATVTLTDRDAGTSCLASVEPGTRYLFGLRRNTGYFHLLDVWFHIRGDRVQSALFQPPTHDLQELIRILKALPDTAMPSDGRPSHQRLPPTVALGELLVLAGCWLGLTRRPLASQAMRRLAEVARRGKRLMAAWTT